MKGKKEEQVLSLRGCLEIKSSWDLQKQQILHNYWDAEFSHRYTRLNSQPSLGKTERESLNTNMH